MKNYVVMLMNSEEKLVTVNVEAENSVDASKTAMKSNPGCVFIKSFTPNRHRKAITYTVAFINPNEDDPTMEKHAMTLSGVGFDNKNVSVIARRDAENKFPGKVGYFVYNIANVE